MKQISIKCLSIFTLLIFIGLVVPTSGVTPLHTSLKNKELTVWFTFIIGRIKNPYYDNNFYFQVVDVTIIGFFYKDLANPYFGVYRLNESWIARDAQYLGINHIRIVLNQSGITRICGILANGDLISAY